MSEGTVTRSRPLVKWENRVEEYIRERGRGGLHQARRECWNRENWRAFCHGHLFGGLPGESEASEL